MQRPEVSCDNLKGVLNVNMCLLLALLKMHLSNYSVGSLEGTYACIWAALCSVRTTGVWQLEQPYVFRPLTYFATYRGVKVSLMRQLIVPEEAEF